MAVATALLPGVASASTTSEMVGSNTIEQRVSSGNKGHYKPPFRFGMGGVPLGNEFAVVTDKDAYVTIEAAWNAGVRYYQLINVNTDGRQTQSVDMSTLSAHPRLQV